MAPIPDIPCIYCRSSQDYEPEDSEVEAAAEVKSNKTSRGKQQKPHGKSNSRSEAGETGTVTRAGGGGRALSGARGRGGGENHTSRVTRGGIK
jgi:hypothetical protein